MNPRIFCREQSYHKTLLLTYSFDPIFFEQIVLPDLWAGRSSDILVLGDAGQIESSTQMAAGQLWHLGRHYLLSGVNHGGAFHPKLFLRLGPKDGMVMVGSGNITSSGWGGNQELGTAWAVGPEHADKGAWLHPFFDSVSSWCSGELEQAAVRRMKDVPWLGLTSADVADSAILHSRFGLPLATTLSARWEGRRFDEVNILTGSTDEAGAFLRWAHSTFGVKRATVALTPSCCSFIPDKLTGLPLEVRIVLAPQDRPMHAKFYWFNGPNGPAAVMGSANCSAAAWLIPPDRGGNIETLVAYDQPNPDDYERVLSVFLAPAHDPADVLLPRPVNLAERSLRVFAFQLKSLQWDECLRRLQADIAPAPQAEMKVELLLDGLIIPMTRLQSPGTQWMCELPNNFEPATVFASVAIVHGSERWKTSPRWINDLASLEHASHSARLLEPFRGLERGASTKEQRQILDELQEVAHTLFNDSASFRDPGVGSIYTGQVKNEVSTTPVNPADLIVHLEESHLALPKGAWAASGSLSLKGILRLLFDSEDDAGSVACNDQDIDEGPAPEVEGKGGSRKEASKTSESSESSLVENRFRERLTAQMGTFLNEMSTPQFANRCTATQMVQAVAFPLAVALRGQRRGWVTPASAEKWALEVFAILFRGKGTGDRELLQAVEHRYALNDQQSIFNDVVGDGTLWMVLVATLGNANWQGVGTDIDKAVGLREVFTAPQLLSTAQPSRIADLIGKLRIADARAYIAVVAPAATQLLNEIESELVPLWKEELRRQSERGISHKVGDHLWREKAGWAICLVEADAGQKLHVRLRGMEKVVMSGYYVNVTDLGNRDAHFGDLIERLRSTVRPGLSTAE